MGGGGEAERGLDAETRGRGGKNAEKARLIAKKYFDITNVQIITAF